MAAPHGGGGGGGEGDGSQGNRKREKLAWVLGMRRGEVISIKNWNDNSGFVFEAKDGGN